jgi:hypothetical protein
LSPSLSHSRSMGRWQRRSRQGKVPRIGFLDSSAASGSAVDQLENRQADGPDNSAQRAGAGGDKYCRKVVVSFTPWSRYVTLAFAR